MSGTQSAAPARLPDVLSPGGMGRLNCALSDSNGSVRTAHRQCARSPALSVSPQRPSGGAGRPFPVDLHVYPGGIHADASMTASARTSMSTSTKLVPPTSVTRTATRRACVSPVNARTHQIEDVECEREERRSRRNEGEIAGFPGYLALDRYVQLHDVVGDLARRPVLGPEHRERFRVLFPQLQQIPLRRTLHDLIRLTMAPLRAHTHPIRSRLARR